MEEKFRSVSQCEFFQFCGGTRIRVLPLHAYVFTRIKGIRIEQNLENCHDLLGYGLGAQVCWYDNGTSKRLRISRVSQLSAQADVVALDNSVSQVPVQHSPIGDSAVFDYARGMPEL